LKKTVAAAGLVAVLGAFGAVMATHAESQGKVDICHIPPGNPDNAHVINVSVNAIPAHLAHGDHLGSCDAPPPPPPPI
jgi:hypothetical protein